MARKKRDAALTDDEMLDLSQKVEDLQKRGWTQKRVARAVGYATPSTLSSACSFTRRLPRARYEEICRLHDSAAAPTTSPTTVAVPASMPSAPATTSTTTSAPAAAARPTAMRPKVGAGGQGAAPASTQACSAAQSASTSPGAGPAAGNAARHPRSPRANGRAAPTSAHGRSTVPGPKSAGSVPLRRASAAPTHPTPSSSWTALDFMESAVADLERCSGELRQAANQVGTTLTAPGLVRYSKLTTALAQYIRRGIP